MPELRDGTDVGFMCRRCGGGLDEYLRGAYGYDYLCSDCAEVLARE